MCSAVYYQGTVCSFSTVMASEIAQKNYYIEEMSKVAEAGIL